MRPIFRFDRIPADGTYKLTITAHKIFGGGVTEKVISSEDAAAIIGWCEHGGTIQTILPHWSPGDRELLLTGLGDTEFHDYLGSDDD